MLQTFIRPKKLESPLLHKKSAVAWYTTQEVLDFNNMLYEA